MNALDIILPIVYIVVGVALIWFVIELVITIRKVRSKAVGTIDELQPTLKNIEGMVSEIQPTITKVDPLVDRVTLTVDSVNLEMMRVDEILEDVSNMTGTLSKTVTTVDSVANAPVDIVSSVATKVRDKFRPKFASDESVRAGLGASGQQQNFFAEFADTAIDAAGEALKERQEKKEDAKRHQAAKAAAREERNDLMDGESTRLSEAIFDKAEEDAEGFLNPMDNAIADGESAIVSEDQAIEDAEAAFNPVEKDVADNEGAVVSKEQAIEDAAETFEPKDQSIVDGEGAIVSEDQAIEDAVEAFEAPSEDSVVISAELEAAISDPSIEDASVR